MKYKVKFEVETITMTETDVAEVILQDWTVLVDPDSIKVKRVK